MGDASYAMNELHQEITRLSGMIYHNELKMKRLREAKVKIKNDQQELLHHEKDIFKPEFSSTTWTGKHAKNHVNIRESIGDSHRNITSRQIVDILDTINAKIGELDNQNEGYRDSISSIRRRITILSDR
ncbi:DUF5082 family protein [Camelliibacillus cellulosilyticus]|uniref:DUF5082 family protein n=1 Tax=Camelliibacillus cellulosilyticus TaxID=2174486 RepID=A0ABV9GR23_9BACL